jgi:hypothetical protein
LRSEGAQVSATTSKGDTAEALGAGIDWLCTKEPVQISRSQRVKDLRTNQARIATRSAEPI